MPRQKQNANLCFGRCLAFHFSYKWTWIWCFKHYVTNRCYLPRLTLPCSTMVSNPSSPTLLKGEDFPHSVCSSSGTSQSYLTDNLLSTDKKPDRLGAWGLVLEIGSLLHGKSVCSCWRCNKVYSKNVVYLLAIKPIYCTSSSDDKVNAIWVSSFKM